MALEFIRERERITSVSYSHLYEWRDCPGAGFSFDCDARGKIGKLNPVAAESYRKCQDGTYDVVDKGIQRYEHSYWEPAAVRCDCRAVIYLDDAMYNTCPRCGLACNGSGQRLRPIEDWEPEDRYAVLGPQNGLDDY